MPTTVSLLLRLPNNLRHWILGQLILLIGGASMLGLISFYSLFLLYSKS